MNQHSNFQPNLWQYINATTSQGQFDDTLFIDDLLIIDHYTEFTWDQNAIESIYIPGHPLLFKLFNN